MIFPCVFHLGLNASDFQFLWNVVRIKINIYIIYLDTSGIGMIMIVWRVSIYTLLLDSSVSKILSEEYSVVVVWILFIRKWKIYMSSGFFLFQKIGH